MIRGADSTGVARPGRGGTARSKTASRAPDVAAGAGTGSTFCDTVTDVVAVGDGPGSLVFPAGDRPIPSGPVVFALPRAALIDDEVRGCNVEAAGAAGSTGGGDSTAISTATPTNPRMSDAMQYPTRPLTARLRFAGGAYPSEAGTVSALARPEDASPATRPGEGSSAARPGSDSAATRTRDGSSASRASTERRRSALRMMLTAPCSMDETADRSCAARQPQARSQSLRSPDARRSAAPRP